MVTSVPDSTKSSPSPLRAAIIGTGKISEEHLRFLAASPSVELAGVCDLSPSLAKYAVDRFPPPGGRRATAFTDSARMLEELRPDVVHVLTPAHTHVKLVTDALQAGAHVVVEKPVAPTNTQFRQLWDLAQGNNRRVIEDHNYRFNEPILRIERLLRQGQLGDVREVDVRMCLNVRKPGGRYIDENLPHPSHNLPAGVIHEFITHLCYLALRFMPPGADFSRVAAAWTKHGDDKLFRHDDLDALVIAQNVHARIRFTSHALPEAFTVTVRGTRGWAETDLFQPHLRVVIPRKGGEQLTPLVNHFVNGAAMVKSSVVGFRNKVMQKTPYEGLQTFLRHTYAALAEGKEPPVTYEDMDRASRLVDALVDEANRV
jgi:predicted dehydrogenase